MRNTFGPMLKDWRTRRRISQMDLGLDAGVSARHISFLETGRARPSQAMVIQLAETLGVPLAARNTLLSAAGFAAHYRARDLGARDMAPIRAAVDWMLDRHAPYPGIAIDRHWTLLRLNAVAAQMFGTFGVGEGDSLLEAFLAPGPGRDAVENWAEVARHMAVRLATESAHVGGDAYLDAAAERLLAEAGPRPPAPGETAAVIPLKYRLGEVRLAFITAITQFGSTEDIALSDMKIELMYPADDVTKDFLERFAAGNG